MGKSKRSSCNCRRRTHGNPKVGDGICYHSGESRTAVVERIRGKRLARRWLEAARARRLDDVDE